MAAVSVISTMKVERPRARLSLAPIRVNTRSTIPSRPERGDVSESREHIHFRQRQRGPSDALCFGGNGCPQLGKQAALDFDDLFLSVENLRFVFLQLGRGKALGVDQSLLAFVIGRDQVQI